LQAKKTILNKATIDLNKPIISDLKLSNTLDIASNENYQKNSRAQTAKHRPNLSVTVNSGSLILNSLLSPTAFNPKDNKKPLSGLSFMAHV
jgi:hypothetical protein